MQSKINLFLFGACDLDDILEDDILYRDFNVVKKISDLGETDNSNLDFSQMSPNSGTSLMSLYSEPGIIAQRVLEILMNSRKRDIISNKFIFKEIVKFPFLNYYKKNARSGDYLILSFSSELYTKCVSHSECFTVLPHMNILKDPENCLHWIYKEYLNKENCLLPFDTKASLELTYDIMEDFARDIYNIFQDRVILVKTHLSNFAIYDNCKVKKVSPNPENILCYKNSKVVTDPLDHNYAERLTSIIMKKFQHHYSCDLPLIKLDEPVFLDANHKWGMNQFHIDINSRHKIAKLIREEIIKKSNLQIHD